MDVQTRSYSLFASIVHLFCAFARRAPVTSSLNQYTVQTMAVIRVCSMATYKPLIERIIALHHLTLGMSEQATEPAIQKLAVAQATQHLDIDRFAIFTVDAAREMVRGTWGTGPNGELVDESDYSAELRHHEMASRTLQRRDLVAVEHSVPLRWCHEVVGTGWNAMVAMWQGDEPLGFVSADNLIWQRPFTPEDQEVLKLLAASIGQMIRRVRAENELRQLNRELEARVATRTEALANANERLKVQARTDPLTGLANRRAFDKAIHREWGRARRTGAPVSLLLLDADYFKRYNDSLGHEAGDRCLCELATVIQAACRRTTDVAARIGGEEFALLLPDTDQAGCEQAGQQIQHALRDMNLYHPDSPVACCLTVSIGTATSFPSGGEPDLFRKADEALYRVKATGRNGMVAAPASA